MKEFTGNGISRRGFLGGALATGGLALAGCGSGSSGSSGGGAKTLRVATPTDVHLSAPQRYNPRNRPLRRTVFDILMEKKTDGTYSPSLATDWEFSSDQKSLVINLTDGVTFHTGRDMTPDDVVYSLQKAVEPESGVQVSTMLERASGVKKSGKSQVTVTFDEPFPAYLDALAMVPIIDKETYGSIQDGSKVIGTGPFVWESWAPDSSFTMSKNPSYWQEGKPYLDGAEFRVMSGAEAVLAAMRSDELDLAVRMLARDAASLRESDRFAVDTTPGFDLYVGCNTAEPPLDDVRVRQAIAYCLDRPRIAKQAYRGFAEPSCTPWPSETPGVGDEDVNRYSYDIAKAKSLLAEAGFSGAEIPLSVSPQDPTYSAVGEIVQYGLTQAGLRVKRVPFTAAEWPKANQGAKFPGLWIAIVGFTASGVAPTLLAANPFNPEFNTSRFTPPEYKEHVASLLTGGSDEEMKQRIDALTAYIGEQAFHNTMVQAKATLARVKGLSGVATDTTFSLKLADAKFSE